MKQSEICPQFESGCYDEKGKRGGISRFFRAFVTTLVLIVASPCLAADPNEFQVFSTAGLPGRLYVPGDYDPSQRYPLITFLHGGGETGTNNIDQVNIHINRLFEEAQRRRAFLYAPQTDIGWGNSKQALVLQMLDEAQQTYNLDPTRLYLTGISLGGGGTWSMLSRYDNYFAAGVPICALSAQVTPGMLDQPVWAFHARDDDIVGVASSRNMVNTILDGRGIASINFPPLNNTTDAKHVFLPLSYTEYGSGGHNIWGRAYQDRLMFDWLFSQSIPAIPEPSGVVLLSLSLAALVFLRRRSASVAICCLTLGHAMSWAPAPACGQIQTTETFSSNTDAYWDKLGSQSYRYSNTDHTGNTAPFAGVASSKGEMGGPITRSATPAYYGFDTGTLTKQMPLSAQGVYHYAGGSGGFFFGWFNNTTTQENSNARNFVGLFMDDGKNAYVVVANTTTHDRERAFNIPTIAAGTTLPFSFTYNPNSHGGVGTMSATMGQESWTIDLDEGIKSGLPLNRFGMFQVGAAGSTLNAYFDDLTFTSMNAVPELAGDFNHDGMVDAADYIVWRKNEGTTTSLPNDNGIGGTIGQAHFGLWRSHFGQSAGSEAGASVNSAVPEPGTLILVILAAVVSGKRGSHRKS